MSANKAKKICPNQESLEDETVDDYKLHINDLNQDCLSYIFQYLSIFEKLKVKEVCKKWNEISELSWISVKSLEIDKRSINGYKLKSDVNKRTALLTNIIQKCGIYLNKLSVNAYSKSFDFQQILKILPEFVHNLTYLSLVDAVRRRDSGKNNKHKIFTDKDLRNLFSKNSKLNTLHLSYVFVKGKCFASLNTNSIEELSLKNCYNFNSNWYDFFTKLNNLQKIKLDFHYVNNAWKVVELLEKANNENILEFIMNHKGYDSKGKLLNFLSKQKQLRFLDLPWIQVDKTFFNNLPGVCLKEIKGIQFFKDAPNSPWPFINLTIFRCQFDIFDDNHSKGLTSCKNLKQLNIVIKRYLLTETGENFFSNLQNLEIFEINLLDQKSIDNILMALTDCSNLKELYIGRNNFTIKGVDCIRMIVTLEKLCISATRITEPQIINIIKDLINLKEIKIEGFWKPFDNIIFEKASEIKKKRGVDNILKIYHMQGNIPNTYSNLELINKPNYDFDSYDSDSSDFLINYKTYKRKYDYYSLDSDSSEFE